MPILKGSVGIDGENWIQDVAAVQAALMVAEDSAGSPYFEGRIDGRLGVGLENAIVDFQMTNGLSATGLLSAMSIANARLEGVVSSRHRNLRGLCGTTTVISSAPGLVTPRSSGADKLNLLPDMRDEIARILGQVRRETGIPLRLRVAASAQTSPARLSLAYGAVSVLDERAEARSLGAGVAPAVEAVIAAVVRRAIGQPRHYRIEPGKPLTLVPRQANTVPRASETMFGDRSIFNRASASFRAPDSFRAIADTGFGAVEQAPDIRVMADKYQHCQNCDHLDMLGLAG
jgi:peptidoglycan hydrolase-like protein with peptidoglycan-binding domain